MVPNIPQVPATSYIIHCTELHWGHLWFMCMSSKSVKIDPFFFCIFQLANWWDNAAYFDCRLPVVITTSPGLAFPKVPFTGKVDHLK